MKNNNKKIYEKRHVKEKEADNKLLVFIESWMGIINQMPFFVFYLLNVRNKKVNVNVRLFSSI